MCGARLIPEDPDGKAASRRRAAAGDDSGDEGKHGRLFLAAAPGKSRRIAHQRAAGADDDDVARRKRWRQRRRPAGGLHFRGVHQRNYGRWSAEISNRGHRVWIGTYDTAEEAARAYDAAARSIHGGKAKTNFPPLVPRSSKTKAARAPPPLPNMAVAPAASAAVNDDDVPWDFEAYVKLLGDVELDDGSEPPPPPESQHGTAGTTHGYRLDYLLCG